MKPAEKAFITAKLAIDAELARLVDLSEDHFNTDPDGINWTDVAELNRILVAIKAIACGE